MRADFGRMRRALGVFLVWWGLGLTVSGCETQGDYFFLERQGAVMPIWVRGNVASGTFILVVHGGPAIGAQLYPLTEAFQTLEQRYAVVYWDQRGAGSSQGSPPPESFAVDQLVGDLDAVVSIVRNRYAPKKLFLLGHSWGGFLGTAWLADPRHQAGVDGYLLVAGAYDFVHWLEGFRRALLEKAARELATGVDVARWEEALEWASGVPDRPSAKWPKEDLETLGAYLHADYDQYHGKPADLPASLLFTSPFEFSAVLRNSEYTSSPSGYDLYGRLLEQDLTPAMAGIQVPTLITWGRYDLNVTVDFAQKAYDALGTAAPDKELVVFEASAHYPFWNEPETWLEVTTSFIDRH